MLCIANPAACHVQFCTFRHATVILQHVNASIVRNCEFSQSDNANVVIEGKLVNPSIYPSRSLSSSLALSLFFSVFPFILRGSSFMSVPVSAL